MSTALASTPQWVPSGVCRSREQHRAAHNAIAPAFCLISLVAFECHQVRYVEFGSERGAKHGQRRCSDDGIAAWAAWVRRRGKTTTRLRLPQRRAIFLALPQECPAMENASSSQDRFCMEPGMDMYMNGALCWPACARAHRDCGEGGMVLCRFRPPLAPPPIPISAQPFHPSPRSSELGFAQVVLQSRHRGLSHEAPLLPTCHLLTPFSQPHTGSRHPWTFMTSVAHSCVCVFSLDQILISLGHRIEHLLFVSSLLWPVARKLRAPHIVLHLQLRQAAYVVRAI